MISLKPNQIDLFKLYFDCFMQYLQDLKVFNKVEPNPKISTDNLYSILTEESKISLISILKKVDSKEHGYGSIVVPKGGFSYNPETHKMVINWLKERFVNIVDVDREILGLEDSLRSNNER